MAGRLQDRVALVTGAARGIGLAAAHALAEDGARVLMCDLDEDIVLAAAGALFNDGLTVKATKTEVSNQASVAQAVAAAVDAWGRLDILVSNAAITDDTPFESISAERWHQVMNVNLDSVLYGAQAALPHLKRSPCASIVNVASIQGLRGQPNSMAYATAKGAVVNLTRCMAVDFFIPGVSKGALVAFAMRNQQVGGLGCYPGRGFIHVDVRDRPRGWRKPVTFSGC